MGIIGALIVAVAIWAWQGPGADLLLQEAAFPATAPVATGTADTPAVDTPAATEDNATPTAVASSPLARAVLTRTVPAGTLPQGMARSPLAQPQSPVAPGDGTLVWMPTVVVDASDDGSDPDGSDPDGSDDGTPEPPDDPTPDPTSDPDAPAPVYTVRVLNTYPHDPQAFTQGLEYRGGELYEGTGLRGRSSLRRVDLESGEVLQQTDLDAAYFGEGITLFDGRIYQLTWQGGVGFVYDAETFEPLDTVAYSTQGWGLTHDGTRLIMSDGSATIAFRDPETFETLETIQVSDGGDLIVRLNELEYIDGEIWANVWLTDRIARIDPATGAVLAWLDLRDLLPPDERDSSDAVLNGIAYDAATDRIFVTGKLWPYLFEIEVQAPES